MTCVLGGVEHLRELMARMASTTLEVLEDTCSLFGQGDLEARRALWGRIDELSRELKELRRTLVNEVLTFMVKYQPLGRELRTSQTLIGIAYDVYRISRYCREI
ncbi:MAG: PhoU domain-containing protein, partial [Desulfurococcaceae archaeon]